MSDADLLELVTEFRDGMLDGQSSENWCFMVCAPLQGYLNAIGVPCDLIEGNGRLKNTNHFWLELEDGRIIDPTADQFTKEDGTPLPKVLIGHMPDWYPAIKPRSVGTTDSSSDMGIPISQKKGHQ